MHYPLSLVLLLTAFTIQAQIPSLGGGKKTWAVIAGISDYREKEITDLHYAHRDASSFYDFLRSPAGGNVPEEQIQLLLNEKATFAGFGAALYWLVDKAGEGDLVYIYFAGHGDVDNLIIGNLGFLLTVDSPPKSYFAGAFPLSTLQYFITTLSVQNKSKVILMADACHAGKLAGSGISGTQLTNQNLQQQYANEVKILACGPDEFSQEGEQWGGGRGAFSYHLIEGLKGLADDDGDFSVNLFEIRRYLEDKVPNETTPSQYPLTIGDRNAIVSLVDPEVLAEVEKKSAKQSPEMGMVATRGMEAQALAKTDSIGEGHYRAFKLALEEKRLLSPEKNSAWYYFQQLSLRHEFDFMIGTLGRNLAVALQDDAQKAINSYLNTDPQEMTRRWEQGPQAYSHIPDYLHKANELLGPRHYMFSTIQAKAFYFEAMLLRMQGEENSSEDLYRQALAKIEAAIALEPLGAHLYNELGLILAGLGEKQREPEAYQKAHELAPGWAMPLYNLGMTERELGKLDSAKVLIEQAIELKPEFPAALIQLGSICELQGNLPEAETAYEKSISLYQTEAVSQPDPLSYYGLGNIYLKTSRPELAGQMYEETIRLDPRHPYAHYALGLALKKTGATQEAIREFQTNLDITPDYLEPYYSICILYAGQNDVEKSLEWLEKGLGRGYDRKNKILEDEALSKIRETEKFRELMKRYFPE